MADVIGPDVRASRLEGRVAVVTGGASGIGLASARRLAAEGAKVVIGDVDPEPAQAAADEVGGLFVPTDVTREADVANHVIPYMPRQGKGSVINTASFVATMGAATSQISYSASKGRVLAMSRELGVEFARQGIRVNALCPGPVNTPLLTELFAADAERAQRRLVHVPMGRFGEPEEIAAAYVTPL